MIEAPHARVVLGACPPVRGPVPTAGGPRAACGPSWARPGDERRLARVLLSVKEQPRVEHVEVVQAGVPWVLPLRVMDPGRLVVKAGDQVIAECSLGWGEDNKLRVSSLAAHPTIPLPRVANRGVGQEEVEVRGPAQKLPGSFSS